MLCSFSCCKNDIPANISDQQFISLNICTTCALYAFITFIISLCITPIKLIKSLLYYFSTFHQVNFTNVLLFKSAIYVFSVTSTEKFPELSKLHCLTWQFHIGSFVLERGSALFRTGPSFPLGISRVLDPRKKKSSFRPHNKSFSSHRLVWSCWLNISVVLFLVDWKSRIFM